MKRLILFLVSAAILVSFAGCGNNNKTEQGTQGSAQTTKGDLAQDKIKADLITSKLELQGYTFNNPKSIEKINDYEFNGIEETERQKENGQTAVYVRCGFKTKALKSVEDANILMLYDNDKLVSVKMTSEPVKLVPLEDFDLTKENILNILDEHQKNKFVFETTNVKSGVVVDTEKISLGKDKIKSLEIINTQSLDEYKKKVTLKIALNDNRTFTSEFNISFAYSLVWSISIEKPIEFEN